MSFHLSGRSKKKLRGVHPSLVEVVERAIGITTVDFGVTEGLRTLERQKNLHQQGRSRTLKSKHLTGHAVDVVAYIGSDITWDIDYYDEIADAFKEAATKTGVGIQWGGAWEMEDWEGENILGGGTTRNLIEWVGSCEMASRSYIKLRSSQGKRPFIDGPHFNLYPVGKYPIEAL